MAEQKPKLDEATRKVLERMLKTPPKPHDEMKVGKKPKQRAVRRKPKKKLTP